MKSVRFDAELETKLARAARAVAKSESEFIREAVAQRCEEVLGTSLKEKWADVIGTVKSGGGRANRTGEAFKKLLLRRRKK